MEGIVLAVMKDSPGLASLVLGAIAIGFALLIRMRKLDLDEITSIGTLQSQQLTTLQGLVKSLTEELTEARAQLSEIHAQNLQLKAKVAELENLVIQYQAHPNRPDPPPPADS